MDDAGSVLLNGARDSGLEVRDHEFVCVCAMTEMQGEGVVWYHWNQRGEEEKDSTSVSMREDDPMNFDLLT